MYFTPLTGAPFFDFLFFPEGVASFWEMICALRIVFMGLLYPFLVKQRVSHSNIFPSRAPVMNIPLLKKKCLLEQMKMNCLKHERTQYRIKQKCKGNNADVCAHKNGLVNVVNQF